MKRPESRFAAKLAAVAALGGFLFGFDSGVINGTIPSLQAAFASSTVGTGFSVASMLIGCAVGAYLAGALAERFGRRAVMAATALGFLVSALGSGIASSSGTFVVYRLLGGVAVGAASVLAPTYIAEIAPAALRGRLAALQQLGIVLGLFLAFLSNYLLAAWAGSADAILALGAPAWRWMFWVEALPSLAFLLGIAVIPESPRYLVRVGKQVEAEAVFVRLLGQTAGAERVQEVERSLAQPSRHSSLAALLRRRFFWVGLALAVFQQLVGINVIFYYGAVLWQAAGFREADALALNVLSGAINIGATLVAMALVDRWGRRPLLIGGALGMTLTLAGLAACFSQGVLGAHGQLQLGLTTSLLALICANGFIVCFALSWGPVVWIALGELYPNRHRGSAMALTVGLHWLVNFGVTLSFPWLLAQLGLAPTYGLYAASALVALLLVRRLMPETRGRELEAL